MIKQQENKNEFPSLQDLLVDEKSNRLSEYLTLTFIKRGDNTQINVSTVEGSPVIYSDILEGISLTGLAYLKEM